MNPPALLIDFGSTFTKVTAIDLDRVRIIGRAQSPSTVATDVCEGLLRALGLLNAQCGLFGTRPVELEALDGFFVRACSSAAGGLRIVVVGLVPGLTVQAANAAALGAGGKVVGAFAFKLEDKNLGDIAALKPDMILLTGGTNGGDSRTILHNAALLAGSTLTAPFVVAGNADAAAAAIALLEAGSKEACRADNVLPAHSALSPESAQDEIRRLFMRRIIDGKGLERIKERVHVVLPTPMAVQKAAFLGSQGTDAQPGCGDLLLVDVGGATTDVYSIGMGKQREQDIMPKGLPEPFAKRTVEGDLGVRWNAATIVARVGADGLFERFQALFPEFAITKDQLLGYVRLVAEQTERVPAADWEFAADAVLARVAVDLAVERHVGSREPYYAREGRVFLQIGKDLTETPTMIGTGGVFIHNPYVERILASGTIFEGNKEILRPADPRILLDPDYILYAVGLLADSHPDVALRIFREHIRPEHADAHDDHDHDHSHHDHAHHHDDDCC